MKVMCMQYPVFPPEGYHYTGMRDLGYSLGEEYGGPDHSRIREDTVALHNQLDQGFGHHTQAGIPLRHAFDQMHSAFASVQPVTRDDLSENNYFMKAAMRSAQHFEAPTHADEHPSASPPLIASPLSVIPREKLNHDRDVAEYACTCQNCGKRFCRSSRLSRHMLTHTNEKPYTCQYPNCVKAYRRKEHLKVHLLTHANTPSERKPFFCSLPGCGAHFSTAYHLKRHSKIHTKKSNWAYDDKKPFANTNSVVQLYNSDGQINRKKKAKSEPVYHCKNDGCDMDFTSLKDLRLHLSEAHPPACHICGKVMVHKRSLPAHILAHTQKKCAFECTRIGCNKKFKSNKSLAAHVKMIHGIDLPRIYKCPEEYCTSQFTYKHTLVRHLVKIHNKPHEPSHLLTSGLSIDHPPPTSSSADDPGFTQNGFPFSGIPVSSATSLSASHGQDSSGPGVLSVSILASASHYQNILQSSAYVKRLTSPQIDFKYPHQNMECPQEDGDYPMKPLSPGTYYDADNYAGSVPSSSINLGFPGSHVIVSTSPKLPDSRFNEDSAPHTEYYCNHPLPSQ